MALFLFLFLSELTVSGLGSEDWMSCYEFLFWICVLEGASDLYVQYSDVSVLTFPPSSNPVAFCMERYDYTVGEA